jgi:hypothetical protein
MLIKMLVGTIRNELLITVILIISSHNQDKSYHFASSFALTFQLPPHIWITLFYSKASMTDSFEV